MTGPHNQSRVEIYDTTLRDGSQAAAVSFSVADKIEIALKLDELGIHYVEGGWPGSNPKDVNFFQEMKHRSLHTARLAAFGSTRRKDTPVERDRSLRLLLESETDVVTIFGKSWLFHVNTALRTDREENLRMIADSVGYLARHDREVIFDAEHFFDGYKEHPDYARKVLEVAVEAGARCLVLCDSNGGCLPREIVSVCSDIRSGFAVDLGIHAHNDSGVAVANTLAAVNLGVVHVQGTVNGYGERSGNANLCSIIPNLMLKMGRDCISRQQLANLTRISRYVDEVANLPPDNRQPFVGKYSFAHKGGIHASGVSRDERTYEHIDPSLVGNRRDVLISELAGKSNVVYRYGTGRARSAGMSELSRALVTRVKELENQGYEFEGATGSFELLAKKLTGSYQKLFDVEGFRVIVERRDNGKLVSEATVKLRVGGESIHTVAEGNGPVHALDQALRKALYDRFPALATMHLADYKVRIVDMGSGTAAKTRVLIESADSERRWGTVGVSSNIIEASWDALLDSVEYKLNQLSSS